MTDQDVAPAASATARRGPLERLLAVADALLAVGAGVAALAALGLAAMLVVEVIATSFFAYSQPWAVEYSQYLLGVILFVGSGWTLSRGGHIRVEVLAQLVGARAARRIDLVVSGLGLAVTAFAALALTNQALRTLEFGSRSYYPSQTPLIYPQALLAAGFVLLTVAFLARVLRLLTSRPAEVRPAVVGEPD